MTLALLLLAISMGGQAQAHAQGCLIHAGWVQLNGSHPVYWAWPEDAEQPVTRTWAVRGSLACRVSQQLRCRIGPTSEAQSSPDSWNPEDTHVRLVHKTDPPYPGNERNLHRKGTVVFRIMISPSGAPYDFVLLRAPDAAFAQAALVAVRQWRFQISNPPGQVHPALANIEVYFKLF